MSYDRIWKSTDEVSCSLIFVSLDCAPIARDFVIPAQRLLFLKTRVGEKESK
jgi:hypothetical protein